MCLRRRVVCAGRGSGDPGRDYDEVTDPRRIGEDVADWRSHARDGQIGPALVVGLPVGIAIAPPAIIALGRGHMLAPDIDPAVRIHEALQRLDLDRTPT